ncbi:MAG: hypothetical protein J6W22_11540 [Fibrobacter sp.]|nr:hypothetical protein [Fibrobacter sp.]
MVRFFSLLAMTVFEFDIAQKGDVVAFGVEIHGESWWDKFKNWLISRGIMTGSGGPYSHIAVVDEVDGELGIRESNGNGSNVRTKMSEINSIPNHAYKNRPYKILGNRSINSDATVVPSNSYNLVTRSCVIQATRWTNAPFYNDPTIFSRYMTGQFHYYQSTSLQKYIW